MEADPSMVYSVRAARRYRWRMAGGRLMAGKGRLRFVPNRIERWRADTYWECGADEVRAVRTRGPVWLVVDCVHGAQRFRVFAAAAAAASLNDALAASQTIHS